MTYGEEEKRNFQIRPKLSRRTILIGLAGLFVGGAGLRSLVDNYVLQNTNVLPFSPSSYIHLDQPVGINISAEQLHNDNLNGIYNIDSSYMNKPNEMTAEQINYLFHLAGSPAQGYGQDWVDASETYGNISLRFALGDYWCESNWNTGAGWPSRVKRNPGNMKPPGQWTDYPTWRAGIFDWMRQVQYWYNYFDRKKGIYPYRTVKNLLDLLTPPGIQYGNSSDFPVKVVWAMNQLEKNPYKLP